MANSLLQLKFGIIENPSVGRSLRSEGAPPKAAPTPVRTKKKKATTMAIAKAMKKKQPTKRAYKGKNDTMLLLLASEHPSLLAPRFDQLHGAGAAAFLLEGSNSRKSGPRKGRWWGKNLHRSPNAKHSATRNGTVAWAIDPCASDNDQKVLSHNTYAQQWVCALPNERD